MFPLARYGHESAERRRELRLMLAVLAVFGACVAGAELAGLAALVALARGTQISL